jgi:hypothetical protein
MHHVEFSSIGFGVLGIAANVLVFLYLVNLLLLYFGLVVSVYKIRKQHSITPIGALVRFAVFAPFAVAATFLSLLFAPVIAVFQHGGWLPWWLRWASTHDEWLFGLSTQINSEPLPASWVDKWWSATRWIWRNPAYHFSHHFLGYKARRGVYRAMQDGVADAVISGDRAVGFIGRAVWGDAFYYEVRIGKFMVGVGWKLWRTDQQDADGICMLATKIKLY